ncbi:hypothetical protein AMJ80_01590 [bacterium SM23_31]|nr:MAG: hypothetical protein AMJ80_01590 [bacterium SM23_31]
MLKPRRRLTKKQLKEDKLLTTIYQIQTYLENEWKRIAIIGSSAIVVLILGFYFYQSNKTQEQEAASELYILEFNYIERQYYDDQLRQELENFLDKYSNSSSGGNATFYLANTCYNLGDYQGAEEYFRKYLDKYDGPDFLKSSALAGIAASFEMRNNYKEASEFYLRSVKEYPDEFLAPENMLGAARTLALAGQKDEAKIQCMNIIEKFPVTKQALDAEKLLARL